MQVIYMQLFKLFNHGQKQGLKLRYYRLSWSQIYLLVFNQPVIFLVENRAFYYPSPFHLQNTFISVICLCHVCHGTDNVISIYHMGPEEQRNKPQSSALAQGPFPLAIYLPAPHAFFLISNQLWCFSDFIQSFHKGFLFVCLFCGSLAPNVFSPPEPFGQTCNTSLMPLHCVSRSSDPPLATILNRELCQFAFQTLERKHE